MSPTRKLQIDTLRMIQKYPDSPWKNHSLTPAIGNMWVAGSYGYSPDWFPIFYDNEVREIRTVGELLAVDSIGMLMGHKSVGMLRYLMVGPPKNEG